MQLHCSLQDLHRGDDTVTLYMQKAKGLFDKLAAVGKPISLTDFNLYVFRGLHGEFRDFVTSLSTKLELLAYSKLHSHLSTHEFLHGSSLQSILTTAPLLPTPLQPPSAYATHRTFAGFSGSSSSSHRGRGRRDWRGHSRNNYNQYNGQSYRGNSGGFSWQNTCNYDSNWQQQKPAGQNQWPRQIRSQIYNTFGHSTQ